MSDSAAENYNPWFSLWFRPRATIRQIVDRDPDRMVWMLVILGALVSLGPDFDYGWYLLVRIVSTVLGAVTGLYLFSGVTFLIGRCLGGRASWRQVRAVVAWSQVPLIASVVLVWLPVLVTEGYDGWSDGSGHSWWVILAELTLVFWSVFIQYAGLKEIQGFSWWRALLNLILVPVAVAAGVFGVLAVWMYATGQW